MPCRVGIRLSSSGTHLRVSSSVDQIACCTPAAFAACAMFLACACSRSTEKCSQKLVTQNTAVGAVEGALQALHVVDVGGDDLDAGGGKRRRLVGAGQRVRARAAKSPERIGQ